MELVWDIYYAVLKDESLKLDQYIRNDSLERRQKKLTKHLFSYCDFQKRPLRSLCLFSIFLWSGLFCCVLVPGTLVRFTRYMP